MVTGVTYRHPGVLAKTATTLDVLSGGRAELGIGAAWYEEEHLGLGVPFPSTAERFERLEETLQICLQMWATTSPYEGKHYRSPGRSVPRYCRPPTRILIGGSGERKTLRMVAQYADACNIFEMGVDTVRGKLAVLQDHCARLDRDYDQIERTMLGRLALSQGGSDDTQTVAQALDRLGSYAELGVDHAIVIMPQVHEEAAWELVPELVQQLATITPAGRTA